jgi:hypothetical protein
MTFISVKKFIGKCEISSLNSLGTKEKSNPLWPRK